MIHGAKGAALESVGAYVSPAGGAVLPARIAANRLYFEMITEGSVYAPDEDTLHGVGTIFVHQPGQLTVFRSPGDAHYACMTARFFLNRISGRVKWPRHFFWQDPRGVLGFCEEMLFAFHHTGIDPALLGDLILSQFRFRLAHFQKQTDSRGIPPRLATVLTYIERHHAKPIVLEDLALQAGMSSSHLHAQFRKHVGMTPHQHLIHERMRMAKHLLVSTDEPVKAVASSVGYANTENFCRAFRKHFGTTAALYRRRFKTY